MPAMLRTFVIALCALLMGSVWASPAAAQTAIAVDSATAIEAASTSVTLNHTVGTGSNRMILVSVAIERNDATVSSVTYAGQPLGLLGRLTDPGAGARLEIWGRLGPNSGANQVAVTLSNSAAVVVGAISFANVDQSNPFAAVQFFGSSTGTTASGSVASTAEQLVIGTIAANDQVGSVTAGAGQTSRWNVVNTADVIGAGSTKDGAAGSTTMSYSFASSGRSVLGIIAIQQANPLIVTNTNDSGGGSLRAAVQYANTKGSPVTISFAIPGAGPHTITLASALPNITANGLTIDGTTQPGTQCGDLWAGTGHALRINVRGGGFDAFRLSGAGQTIKGLSLSQSYSGVTLDTTSTSSTIQCNFIGLLADGTSNGNSWGVLIYGAGARIGGLDAGQGNVISANYNYAVTTHSGSTDTSFQGNFIGTDPTGMAARPNGSGIRNWNGTATWRDVTHNLISGNNQWPLANGGTDQIRPSTDKVRIQRNRIGFNRTLTALMLNGNDAIAFYPSTIADVLIGGDAATQGNQLASSDDGIDIRSASNVEIKGNTIARSVWRGIRLEAVSGATIGGSSASEGNVIGGNGSDGINIYAGSSNISILGNRIGPVTITGGTFENGEHGIWIENTSNVTIGDGTALGRNFIGGNRRRAIQGTGTNSGITINGNYIGTDLTGNVAVANGLNEGSAFRDAIAFNPGGTVTNLAILNNVIGGYGAALIELWGSTTNGVTIQGNSLGVGANGTSQIVSGNVEDLIWVGSGSVHSNLLIGGSAAGQGNTIAFSSRSGIRLESTGNNIQVIGNTIRNNTRNGIYLVGSTRAAIISNHIFANGLIGIDLNENGVTANDAGDGDAGPNDLLNFPVIGSVRGNGANRLIYNVTLDAPAAANGYRIEFFASSAADPSGFGEGERILGYVDIAHGGGLQSYSGTLTTLEPVSIGNIISATTTRRTPGGAWDITSEFSAVGTADGAAALSVAMATSLFEPPADAAFFTPGNDVLVTTTISNGGTGSTDPDSVFVTIAISPDMAFFNGVTPSLGGVVSFNSGTPLLAFTPTTDLRFSDAAAAPASFADCTYPSSAGYDARVRHVCVNPKGSLPSGTPAGQFAVQIRAQIN